MKLFLIEDTIFISLRTIEDKNDLVKFLRNYRKRGFVPFWEFVRFLVKHPFQKEGA